MLLPTIDSLRARLAQLKSPAVQFAIISCIIALVQTLLQAEVWLASRNAVRVLSAVSAAPQAGLLQYSQAAMASLSTPSPTNSPTASPSPTNRALTTVSTNTNSPTSSPPSSPRASLARKVNTTDTAIRNGRTRESSDDGDDDRSESKRGLEDEDTRGAITMRRARSRRAIVSPPARSLVANNSSTALFSVVGLSDDEPLLVTGACAAAMGSWPLAFFGHLATSSAVFLAYHIWMLGLAAFGIWYKSIPHLCAVLIAHFLAAVYAIFQLTQTKFFHQLFHDRITFGVCAGTRFSTDIWRKAIDLELSIIAFEISMTAVAGYLGWKLMSDFAWCNFKQLGADRAKKVAYRLTMIFQVFLQLSAFFIIAIQGIWIHELLTTDLASSSMSTKGYQVFLGLITAGVVPFSALASYGVRKQNKAILASYLVFALGLFSHGIFLITRETFASTRAGWKFLTFMSSLALLFITVTVILGVFCLFNLGKEQRERGLVLSFIAPAAIDETGKSSSSNSSEKSSEVAIFIPSPSPALPRPFSIALTPSSISSTDSAKSTPSKRIVIKGSKNHPKTGSAHSSYQSESFPRIHSLISPQLNDLWPSFLTKLEEVEEDESVVEEEVVIARVEVVKIVEPGTERGGGFLGLAPTKPRRAFKKPAPLQLSRFSNSTLTITTRGSRTSSSSATTEKSGKVDSKSAHFDSVEK